MEIFTASVKTLARRTEGKMEKYTVEGSVNVMRNM
jgi:hypothetical protein